jgi:hypothetical protein
VVGSLSEGERQRLAALFAATANALLVMFVLAVALRLLAAKLPDPFWLLASTGAPTRTEILRPGPLTAGAAVVRGQRSAAPICGRHCERPALAIEVSPAARD